MLPWIPENAPSDLFPHPSSALTEPNGLLAAGGDLSPNRLIAAYSRGIFPWFGEDEPILWWSPDPRAVIQPARFHLSRSLLRQIRRGGFSATLDTAFSTVLAKCAEPRETQDGTWITAEMKAAYIQLHQLGHAHSLEIWQNDELVGGVYGVSCGRAFFGESMFSRCPSGSKIALAALCKQLERWKFILLDCQVESDHLTTLGATPWPRRKFLQALQKATVNTTQADSTQTVRQWQIDADLQPLSQYYLALKGELQ